MDFFSEKELVTQTGHEVSEWPLVFLKEVVDNALDECEEAGIAPVIDISADAAGITVRDNGRGLPESTLEAAMDFRIRASNREAYVAPDRGAQGNALKTLLAMPTVVDREQGRLIVSAHGKRHSISCRADAISQRPVIHDDSTSCPTVGTEIRIEWQPRDDECGEILWPFDGVTPTEDYGFGSFRTRFLALVEGFGLFNPHATIRVDWFGTKSSVDASNPEWQKWRPSRPTSPHWYEGKHLERLIGAYVTHDRDTNADRLVSDFIAEFDGMSGSHKRTRVLNETGLRRVPLSALVRDDALDSERIGQLLAALQSHTRPVKPERLGFIGEDHFRERLLSMGVVPDSFRYSRKIGKDGVPWVLESAFGWLGNASQSRRRIHAGVNWSACIKNPFRSFGSGEGLEALLNKQHAGSTEPIVYVVHLAHPRVEYTDRGKSALVIPSGKEDHE